MLGLGVLDSRTNVLMHALDDWLPERADAIATELEEARQEWC